MSDKDMLDRRPLKVCETSKVVKEIYHYLDADRRRPTPKLTPVQTARAWHVLDVLQWSESGGRNNPYIELPEVWKIADIERVLGNTGDDEAPTTNAAWRKVTRMYEQSSTAAAGGRTI